MYKACVNSDILVSSRCVCFKVCPSGVADRVNLGLVPSSEEGWITACRALKSDGGILHIHGNVTSRDKEHASQAFGSTLTFSSQENRSCATEMCKDSCCVMEQTDEPCTDGASAEVKNVARISLDNLTTADHQADKLYPIVGDMCSDAKIRTDALGTDFSSVEIGKVLDISGERETPPGSVGYKDTSCPPDYVSKECAYSGKADSLVLERSKRFLKYQKSTKVRPEWLAWGHYAKSRIAELLRSLYNRPWNVVILHIEHVKSYAPHVDHLVLDLKCTPC